MKKKTNLSLPKSWIMILAVFATIAILMVMLGGCAMSPTSMARGGHNTLSVINGVPCHPADGRCLYNWRMAIYQDCLHRQWTASVTHQVASATLGIFNSSRGGYRYSYLQPPQIQYCQEPPMPAVPSPYRW